MDFCEGIILGTTTDPLTYSEQGEYIITWSYDDGNNNIETQEQTVVVEDITDPTIECVGNQNIDLEEGETTYTVQGIEFDATAFGDNCQIESITNNINGSGTLSGEELSIGSNIITWTIEDEAGNTANCSFFVVVNEFVGIADLMEFGISIYPNPSNGIFTINFAKVSNFGKVVITDITGRVIFTSKLQNTKILKVDLSNQVAGIYIINFKSETKNFSSKIIIE